MSLSEDEKYQKKYLKYKEKYFELKGGSKWSSFKIAAKKGISVASDVVSHPAVQAVASSAATAAITTAVQRPEVQAKLAQAQQAYYNSPTAQSAFNNQNVPQASNNPDEIWKTLTMDQKQKLISML
jgi:spermidine/putrescine-binding protein